MRGQQIARPTSGNEGERFAIMRFEIQVGGLTDALAKADLAITKSGTVTMECALHGVPAVVFYKTSWPTYFIGKQIITVKYLAMPNLITRTRRFIRSSCSRPRRRKTSQQQQLEPRCCGTKAAHGSFNREAGGVDWIHRQDSIGSWETGGGGEFVGLKRWEVAKFSNLRVFHRASCFWQSFLNLNPDVFRVPRTADFGAKN